MWYWESFIFSICFLVRISSESLVDPPKNTTAFSTVGVLDLFFVIISRRRLLWLFILHFGPTEVSNRGKVSRSRTETVAAMPSGIQTYHLSITEFVPHHLSYRGPWGRGKISNSRIRVLNVRKSTSSILIWFYHNLYSHLTSVYEQITPTFGYIAYRFVQHDMHVILLTAMTQYQI